MKLISKGFDYIIEIWIFTLIALCALFLIFFNYDIVEQQFSLLALFSIVVSCIISVLMKSNIDWATQLVETLNVSYCYIRYDFKTKKFYLSEKLKDTFDIKESVLDDLDQLPRVMSEDVINRMYKGIELTQKSNSNYIIDDVNVNIGGKKMNFRCEICCIKKNNFNYSAIIILNNISQQAQVIREKEEQLKEASYSLHNLQIALDNVPFAIGLANSEGQVCYKNQYFDKIYIQEHRRAILDRGISNYNHKSNKGEVFEQFVVISGQRRLMRFYFNYLPEYNLFLTFSWDISEIEEITKKLSSSINSQADLLESTSHACAIFDTQRKLKFYNQAYAKLWDLDSKWLDSYPYFETILDHLHQSRKLPEQSNYKEFKTEQLNLFSNLTETYNEFFYLPDGRTLRVLMIPYSSGGVLISYEDMTDHIELESSYNTLIAVQKATLDNLHEGICVFGENGRLKLNNPIYAKMWKLDQKYLQSGPHLVELLDATSHFFSNLKSLTRHRDNLMTVFAKRTSIQERIERIDGSVISRVIVPLPDGQTLLTDMDMTDSAVVEQTLREKNDALKDADRIKTEFLANVSYELRSPLTSIIGLSESLQRNYFGKLTPKQSEYIGDIVNSAEQLLQLINDVIDLTSIDAGYIDLDIEEYDAKESLETILPLVKERIRDLNINMSFSSNSNSDYKIFADEVRIKQAFFKLLSNAIEFSNVGGKININIGADEDNVYLTIEDNGKGISVTEKSLIFERFYQTQNNKSLGRASGLGLSIVKTFIELHGGKVMCDSAKDTGTKFTIIIPKNNPELISMYKARLLHAL